MFLTIIASIVVLQVIIVTFGSLAFGVYRFYGLTIHQWLISVAFGAVGLLVNLGLKGINEGKMCIGVGNKEVEVEIEGHDYATNMKRRSSAYARGLEKNHIVA